MTPKKTDTTKPPKTSTNGAQKGAKSGQLAAPPPAELDTPLDRRVGPKTAKKLAKLGLNTVRDLLYLQPRRLQTWAELSALENLNEGEEVTFIAQVTDAQMRSLRNRPGAMFTAHLYDGAIELTATFFARHQAILNFHARNLVPGNHYMFSGKLSQYRGKWQLTHPEYDTAEGLSESELAARAARPALIYPQSAGLPSWVTAKAIRTILDTLKPEDVPEVLPEDFRKTQGWDTTFTALHKLHQPETIEEYRWAQKRLAFDEALITQTALAQARQGYQAQTAHPLTEDPKGLLTQIESALPFELTDSQKQVNQQIAQDLAKSHPMQRLLQGDVGSGKTIVAVLALARALAHGYQGALLAPTEVLATQHYLGLLKQFPGLIAPASLTSRTAPIELLLLTGSLSAKDKRQALAILASGKPVLVIGTHALLSEHVQIPNLALLVVDEQHRFGVKQREILREKTEHVPHLLVMTATPIPRTVAMTLFGDLEVSILGARPRPGEEITTYLVPAEKPAWMARLWTRTAEEVHNGAHVYIVCPRISEDEKDPETRSVSTADAPHNQAKAVKAATRKATPSAPAEEKRKIVLTSAEGLYQKLQQEPALQGIKLALLHGRQSPAEKAQIMDDFKSGKTPVLISTTVIEVGVDDPEATLMIIMDAQQYGLSALHQLRGRVGRGSRPGTCLAVYQETQGDDALTRLQALAESNDGFYLAEKDLEIRREGDVLGEGQAGRGSSLKFISVLKDLDTIKRARSLADHLVSEDPELAEHPDLKAAIDSALAAEQQENLLRS
ncbi:ATP-dependent DNA helicase RecG [Boudabousia liubingyangii]|uniref:ATP-dependent DNA helicase RecG n=1 Tax=Boudabousia liubingyangii TaxID=1921764 RepID=UPI0009F91AE7|nr:ATP-dependent DNA helicase RecG [Boudabousia liubingyangii]